MSLFAACAMVFIAYVNTPFLQVRPRVYAFPTDDRRPVGRDRGDREPYGAGVTAVKSWWRAFAMLAVFACGAMTYFIREGSPWLAASSLLLIAAIALAFGHRDTVLCNSIASGQRVQFALISVVTIGVFTVLYLAAYQWAARGQRHGRHP